MDQYPIEPIAITEHSDAPIAQPRFERFRIGELECCALSDGAVVRPLPPAQTVPAAPPGGASALFPLSCMAVRIPGIGLVLIDTGFGPDAMIMGKPMGSAGRLPASMAAAGIAPQDVDVVLISHMHPDHVGGMHRRDGTKAFPNATYHVGEEELAFWRRDPLDLSKVESPPPVRAMTAAAAERMLRLVGDDLRTFRAGEEALPGVRTLPLPGHAPGQVGFILSSGGETLLFMADAMAHPVISIETPDVCNPMDMDSSRAVQTRHEVIALLSGSDWQTFVPHFPWPSRGRISGADGKPTWVPTAAA